MACLALVWVGVLGGAAPRMASAAGFQFGLADYEPATFSDPRVADLGVKIARDVIPWNAAAVPRDRAAVSAWLNAARLAGISPLITFQHADGGGRAPTAAHFLADFLRFRSLFPWVTEFTPWDEATHPGQPTAHNPKLAALYYNAMVAHCPSCLVTAPDTLDSDADVERWIHVFLKTARPYPRIWPFNPYQSASRDNPAAIIALLRSVHGRVWFSEIGGIVWWRLRGRLIYNGQAAAAKVTANIFKLARLSSRITRIYYYHWRSPGNPHRLASRFTWDAGLVSAGGIARPSLLVLAKALHRRI